MSTSAPASDGVNAAKIAGLAQIAGLVVKVRRDEVVILSTDAEVDAHERDKRVWGELLLLKSMLELAIRDIMGDFCAIHSEDQETTRQSAHNWIFCGERMDDDHFSFEYVCEELGLCSQTVRNKVILGLKGDLELSVPKVRRDQNYTTGERLFG